jgi:sugar phosphate isomerase/epimerase
VRDHVEHIHVKDATWDVEKNNADYNWPGDGQGRVRDILQDAIARGYQGGLSIEPHMVVVFHDAHSKANDEAARRNFTEYGRRLMELTAALQTIGVSR